ITSFGQLVSVRVQATTVDWTPILSTLVPIIFGMIVENLDKKMADYLAAGVVVLTPFMGWVFGVGINLFNALQSGLQGILLTVVFYVLLVPILVIFEQRILHEDGVSSLAVSSIA